MHPSKSLKDISAEIKTWFDLMDLDNDDQISWIEFWGVLARPPFLPTEATYKRVIGFFKSWKAPVAKFERAVQRLLADNEIRRKYLALESKFREAFDRMDTDKSGFIDKTEFVSFIMPFIKHQCAGLAFPEEELLNEVDRRFSIMDVNMDQKVSWPGNSLQCIF
jgi:Ca2+-binding EF-hand superfamily protein